MNGREERREEGGGWEAWAAGGEAEGAEVRAGAHAALN